MAYVGGGAAPWGARQTVSTLGRGWSIASRRVWKFRQGMTYSRQILVPPHLRRVKSIIVKRASSTQGHRTGLVCRYQWYVVSRQGIRHLNISHSHPFTNKARTTYAMLLRASTTFLSCAQSLKPLSDAQADSKAQRRARTRRSRQHNDQLNNLRATWREIWCCPTRR